MIRLLRPPEPPELTRERTWRVARALLPPTVALDTEAGYNLPPVREQLFHAQHGLCAYCGDVIEQAYYPIDHFRPRARYWWLTWTWENLWLVCPMCQGKSDRFDLHAAHDGTITQLPPPTPTAMEDAFDLRLESPCLLDPAVDTPQDHLFFEPTRPNEQGWDWQARTERGHHTLDLLKLNRSARTGAYERLQVHLERVLEDAAELLSKADSLEKQRIWDKCLHHYIQPPQIPHRVASWWFLKYFLEKHNLPTRRALHA